jgi:phosphate transport system ATP-binding protein
MLFQQPVVFPSNIHENVLFGAKRLRRLSRSERAEVVERALREAALWDEVKDRLRSAATTLSVGQQQRLSLARTLAVQPEIILMDEPTSALDPKSTQAIVGPIRPLKSGTPSSSCRTTSPSAPRDGLFRLRVCPRRVAWRNPSR